MRAQPRTCALLACLFVCLFDSLYARPQGEFPFPPDVRIPLPVVEPERFLPGFLPTPLNVTFHPGQDAILRCAVENKGARSVVWRKASESHPLTIGKSTYIPDQRFQVVHKTHSLEWNLLISDVTKEDQGVYECQVVAKDRNIRQFITLNIDDHPVARPTERDISINGSLFVERGQTLTLVCNATGSEYPPDDIDWFKDGNKIKNSERTRLSKDVNLSARTIISSLQVFPSNMADAGTYVCRTSDLQVTSAKVNILNTGKETGKRESAGATSVTSYSYGRLATSGPVTRVTPGNQSVMCSTGVHHIWTVLVALSATLVSCLQLRAT